MDYFSVTQTAFLSATGLTLVLTLILIKRAFTHSWIRPFIFGFFIQFCWLLSISLTYSNMPIASNIGLILESAHYLAWFISLAFLLNIRSNILHWPKPMLINSILILATTCTTILLILLSQSKGELISAGFALTAVFLLVFSEQTMRNAGNIRLIKLIALCLLGQFIFDTYIYSRMTFNYSLEVGLWQARAAIAFTSALAVSLGAILFAGKKEQQSMAISRPMVFYTTSAIFILIAVSTLSVGIFYVKKLNGYLGSYLFTLTFISSIVLLASVILSKKLQSNIEVFISKHFFSLKYDYREQWLQTIAITSSLSPGQADYYNDILSFTCQTFNTSAGILWLNQNGKLRPYAQHSFYSHTPEFELNEDFIKRMLKEGWIYSPLSSHGPISKNNDALPDWFLNNSLWMVCPLLSQMKLIGMIAISKPNQSADVTFEDRDLMTNLADQFSSQILLHQQETLLSNSKQMETYNRLSAFIMHDVNNVIAQLALIVRNAEKHKKNPAFIEDMIKTVNNSVERMHGLIQKFKPEASESLEKIAASSILKELQELCSDRAPTPSLHITSDFNFTADRQKTLLALKNIVRNAQDATPADGHIKISTKSNPLLSSKHIVISDTGVGMTQEFINTELFRPFATTKINSGVGIGAHLTRSYLEHIGAILTVESEPGIGSHFDIAFN